MPAQATPSKPCSGIEEGTVESRVRFRSEQVRGEDACEPEPQTRQCTGGVWSTWTGSFGAESCRSVIPERAACDGQADGTVVTRVQYAAASVPFGAACQSVSQSRTCRDGAWSPWSGEELASFCAPAAPANCGNVAHGAVEARLRYAAASVPFGQACASELQTRSCFNGALSPWTGSFGELACAPENAGANLLAAPAYGGTLSVFEGGSPVTMTLAPDAAPSAPVHVRLTLSGDEEVALSESELVFASGATTAREVEFSAELDGRAEGQRFLLLAATVESEDARFDGLDVGPWVVALDDAGKPGIVVAPRTPLVTTNAGGSAFVDVSLARKPNGSVTIELASLNANEAATDPLWLTFDEDDWDVPRLVQVRGLLDAPLDEGEVPFEVRVSADASTTDVAYFALPAFRLSFVGVYAPVNECAVPNWNTCGYGTICFDRDRDPRYECACPPGTVSTTYGCVDRPVVAAGQTHSCLRKTDGRLACWGYNGENRASVPALAGGRRFASVFAGPSGACGLDDLGTAYCWGTLTSTVAPPTGERWVSMTFADNLYLLSNAGRVWKFSSGPIELVPGLASGRKVRALDGFGGTLCTLDDAGALRCTNSGGATMNTPTPSDGAVFERLSVGVQVCAIDTQGALRCAVTEGQPAPPALPAGRTWSDVSVGVDLGCGIDSAGELRCWGGESAEDYGALVPPNAEGRVFVSVSVGDAHACALDSAEKVYCWGEDSYGQAQTPDDPGGASWQRMSGAASHTCALDAAGRLECWGFYQNSVKPPKLAAGLTWMDVRATSVQDYSFLAASCGIDSAGEGHCWGSTSAQLPRKPEGTTWVELAPGVARHCGVASDGSLSCADQDGPTAVPLLPNGARYEHVAGGFHTMCASDSAGDVHCFDEAGATRLASHADEGFRSLDVEYARQCGVTNAGRLLCFEGASAVTPIAPPTQGATWARIAAEPFAYSGTQSCAVDSAGGVRCFPDYLRNDYGQGKPPPLPFGVGWRAVEPGASFTCGIDTLGRRWCWGVRKLAPF